MEQAKFLPHSPKFDVLGFGSAVATTDEYALVGSERDADEAGSTYDFWRQGRSWKLQGRILPDEKIGSQARFGCSLSISGERVLIGAFGDNEHGLSYGSAYMFDRVGNTWVESQKLFASSNGTVDTLATQTWSVLIDSLDQPLGSPVGPTDLHLEPLGSAEIQDSIEVPGSVLPGEYRLLSYAGEYPSGILDKRWLVGCTYTGSATSPRPPFEGGSQGGCGNRECLN